MKVWVCAAWALALSLSFLLGGNRVTAIEVPPTIDTERTGISVPAYMVALPVKPDTVKPEPERVRRVRPLPPPKPTDSVAVPFENTIVTCTPERVPSESLAFDSERKQCPPPRLETLLFQRALVPRVSEAAVQWERSALVFAGIGAAAYAVHRTYLKELWWQDRGSFHFAYDPGYAKNMDKLGHATVWYFVSTTAWMLYRWAGYSDMESRWLGLGTVALLHLETEGHEGFSRYFGFDPVDYFAGISGGALIVARGYWPELERLTFKWSFIPRSSPPYTRREPWLKDYHAQKYWVCLDVYEGWSVAVGFNLSRYENGLGTLQVWLSPDFRFTSLGDSEFLYLLDFLKLPLPAVQIHPDLRFVWCAWLN